MYSLQPGVLRLTDQEVHRQSGRLASTPRFLNLALRYVDAGDYRALASQTQRQKSNSRAQIEDPLALETVTQ